MQQNRLGFTYLIQYTIQKPQYHISPHSGGINVETASWLFLLLESEPVRRTTAIRSIRPSGHWAVHWWWFSGWQSLHRTLFLSWFFRNHWRRLDVLLDFDSGPALMRIVVTFETMRRPLLTIRKNVCVLSERLLNPHRSSVRCLSLEATWFPS